jgi:hypothetical protein
MLPPASTAAFGTPQAAAIPLDGQLTCGFVGVICDCASPPRR